MTNQFWRRCALMLLLGASLLLAAPLEAAPPACAGRLESPTRVVIDCQPGYATASDTIDVYLRQPAPPGATWQTALSYNNAVWIYRVGQRPALIVDFRTENGQVHARLYDDQTGDGEVSYTLDGDPVMVSESRYPTITATAQGGWWLADGTANLNLDLEVDGSVQATIETFYHERLKNDGTRDYTIHVRDTNQNGRAEYEWRQVYPGLSEDDGFYHSVVNANTADDEPGLPNTLFWPLIGGEPVEIIKKYRQSLSPIHIDWGRAKLDLISEFVASRGSPHNYFVYSIRRIEEGTLNATNFESPFAFYNLGGPNPDFPDLSIRVVYYPAGDIRKDMPVQQVDLTWRHNDSAGLVAPSWDYRLGLLGRNAAAGQVDFKEFSLAITPYEQVPGWVVNNRWDMATFVARERPQYLTTEHIYEWSTLEGVVIDHALEVTATDRLVAESISVMPDYVRGEYTGDISRFYRRIGVGLRGEFTPHLNDQARVYLSPVDHKLHLLHALQGVWTLAPTATLSVANLDDDPYLDQWTYQQTPDATTAVTLTRQLNVTGSHLLYSDGQRVIVRQAVVKPSLLEMLPPTTPAERETLGRQLALQPPLAPADLLGMLGQFPGQELRIDGARLREVRLLADGGFRAELILGAGFSVSAAPLFNARDLAPGAYVVTYNGQFSVQPLTPPDLSSNLMIGTPQQLEPNSLDLALTNSGLEDAPGATLQLWALSDQAPPAVVISQTVDLLAQETITRTAIWAPVAGGSWTLSPTVRLADSSLVQLAPVTVVVAPERLPATGIILQTSSTLAALPVTVLAVLTFAGLAGLLWWAHWRASRGERYEKI